MFINEPEGTTYEELQQYLGFASAMGNGIKLRLKSGQLVDAFLYYSQNSLPEKLKLFRFSKEKRKLFLIKCSEIVWFKMLRHGRMETTVDEKGIPIVKMPVIMIAAKSIKGTGKIINPEGTTAIIAEEINFNEIS